MFDSGEVTGAEVLRRLRKLGKRRGVDVHFDPDHGKGSHGTLHFGQRSTTLKDRKKEIGHGLLRQMCANLGVDFRDL